MAEKKCLYITMQKFLSFLTIKLKKVNKINGDWLFAAK